MAFRPYIDSDSETMLSQLMARTGRSIGQMELQLSINGWNSQMFVVKGDVSDITVDDVKRFATRRGYAGTSFAVKRLCEVIRGSRSPVIERYGVGKWRMRFGPKRDCPSYETAIALIRTWALNYHPQYVKNGAGQDMIYLTTQIGSGLSSSHHPVPTWTPETTEHRLWIEANGGVYKDRWMNPFGWFVEWCASQGLNLSAHNYVGLVPTNSDPAIPTGGAGFTIIMGPVDLLGRQPVWHMPLIDERLACINFGMVTSYDNGVPQPATIKSFRVGGATLAGAGLGAFTGANNKSVSLQTRVGWNDIDEFMSKIESGGSGEARPNGYSEPVPTAEVDALKLALGDLGLDLVQATADGGKRPYGQPPYYQSFVRNHTFLLRNWKVAVPYGLEELTIPLSKVGVSTDDKMPVVKIEADKLYIATRFQVLREYAERCRQEPGTTPVESANLKRFIDQSASKADALIYSTVFASAFEPPSMEMVENLEFVRKGRKAGVNVLDDKQDGVNVTLRDLAKKLDSDRKKGRSHSFFSQIVDEAMSLDDLASAFVHRELIDSAKWSFSVSDVQGADDTIFGRKSGAEPVAVDPTDAAFLVAHGATSTVPDRVWSLSAIDQTVIADMKVAGSGQISGRDVRPSHHSNRNTVKWDNLAASAFCDASGYPVMAYADQDSYVRAFLILKGPQGEPSDLLASMFFANTLDM